MTNENEIKETETHKDVTDDEQGENASTDGEFKVVVRKLEMPVRPRGVLADG